MTRTYMCESLHAMLSAHEALHAGKTRHQTQCAKSKMLPRTHCEAKPGIARKVRSTTRVIARTSRCEDEASRAMRKAQDEALRARDIVCHVSRNMRHCAFESLQERRGMTRNVRRARCDIARIRHRAQRKMRHCAHEALCARVIVPRVIVPREK